MPVSHVVRRVAAVMVTSTVAVVVTALAAPSAHASCAGDPQPSPYSFTGVVVSTELGQRVARVRTDDGELVVVRGTQATEESVTTVDRTYITGHRYVFHPSNSTSPYQDSMCSATLDLGAVPTTSAVAAGSTEPELAGDDGTAPAAAWVVGGAAGAVLLVVGLVLVRRSRAAHDVGPVRSDAEPVDEPTEGG